MMKRPGESLPEGMEAKRAKTESGEQIVVEEMVEQDALEQPQEGEEEVTTMIIEEELIPDCGPEEEEPPAHLEGGAELVHQSEPGAHMSSSTVTIEETQTEVAAGSLEQQEEDEEGVEYGTLHISSEEDGGGGAVVVTTEPVEMTQQEADEHQVYVATDGGGHQLVTMEGGIVTTIDGSVEVPSIEGGTVDGLVEDGVVHVPVSDAAIEESQVDDGTNLEDMPHYQNIIIQHMDIAEPLTTLRRLLEARLQCSLADHDFYLQDSILLEPTKNLVSQCVQGSGMVQINVEVKSQPGTILTDVGHQYMKPRLNIVDILKPAEEVDVSTPLQAPAVVATPVPTTKVVIPFPEESENVTRWIVDQTFRKEQERLKIPFDPSIWNAAHVKHWLQWAVKEFDLEGVDINEFKLNGHQLCELKHEDFVQYIPDDKGDVFWTHLELLRKCKFVAVIQQPTPHAITTVTVSATNHIDGRTSKSFNKTPRTRTIMVPSERSSPGNRTGNNGQIQLWQFLLELLTDKDCREVIHWIGDEGEFKLNNPEMVAQMWGQRKNKPTMNYEKLSRALRYYYDGDMIAKVHGKRFVYKFVCDLRMLLGYTAGELNRLVTECAEKKLQRVRESLRPSMTKRIVERS